MSYGDCTSSVSLQSTQKRVSRPPTAPLLLPSDRGRCGGQADWTKVEARPGTLFRQLLTELGREIGFDWQDVALALFVVLLYRHTQQAVVSLGVWKDPAENKSGIDVAEAPAMRPVSCSIDERATFIEMVGALSQEKFRLALMGGLDASVKAIFGITDRSLDSVEPYWSRSAEIALTVLDDGSELILHLGFNGHSFRQDRMTEFLAQYQILAEQAAKLPLAEVLDYSLVTNLGRSVLPDPSREILKPRYPLLTEAFLARTEQRPDAVAVSQGDRIWSYAELARTSQQLAVHLHLRGINPGHVVAVTGRRSFAVVSAMLAVFRSGGILLTLDPKLPAERQKMMMEEAGAKYLISVGMSVELQLDNGRILYVDPSSGAPVGAREDAASSSALPILEPESPAYVFFTSGSTGTPKAVLGCHHGLGHFLTWQSRAFNIDCGDRASHITALSFDVVLRDVFLALTSGATLCIPAEEDILDPSAMLGWMDTHRITVMHIVPSLARAWLNHVPSNMKVRYLRRVFFAGEPLTDTLVNRFRLFFGTEVQIVNLYGPTETTLAKCFHMITKPEPGVQPIGCPLPETQVLILNQRGRMCGVNETGEINIRTPFRTFGYLNSSEANERAFVPNPFRKDPNDLVYRTGDRGRYRADGLLEIAGRMDNQVKIRGMRVEPGEVESAIGHHEDIREVAVVALDDPATGKFLAAYLVLKKPATSVDQSSQIDEVRQFLRTRLPDHMVPATFAILDALPLNPNGKINKKALPVPDRDSFSDDAQVRTENAVNAREEELVAIWKAALGRSSVSVNESFAALGGDSLSAIGALIRMKLLGIPDNVARGIFRGLTIREIARDNTSGSKENTAPGVATNLLINIARGLLVILLVVSHWIGGVISRLPSQLSFSTEYLEPLFSLATPGFAFVFGVVLGKIYYPKYKENPVQTRKMLLFGTWILVSGICLTGVANLAASKEAIDFTSLINSFYSALVYYAIALSTATLWFRVISRSRSEYFACSLLIVMFYLGYRLSGWAQPDEGEGLAHLFFLLVVSKFSYFNMSVETLAGVMCGIYLDKHEDIRDLPRRCLTAGLVGMVSGVAMLYLANSNFQWTVLNDSNDMGLWRWSFYTGASLVLAAGIALVVIRLASMPVMVRRLFQFVGVIGQCAFPVFVLHLSAISIKGVLVKLGASDSTALMIVLVFFFVSCGWCIVRLYRLHYGDLKVG
jgi:amino acid adenylation domain-containing protein